MVEKRSDFIADNIAIHQDFGTKQRQCDIDISLTLLEVVDWINNTETFYANTTGTFRVIAEILKNEVAARKGRNTT